MKILKRCLFRRASQSKQQRPVSQNPTGGQTTPVTLRGTFHQQLAETRLSLTKPAPPPAREKRAKCTCTTVSPRCASRKARSPRVDGTKTHKTEASIERVETPIEEVFIPEYSSREAALLGSGEGLKERQSGRPVKGQLDPATRRAKRRGKRKTRQIADHHRNQHSPPPLQDPHVRASVAHPRATQCS